MAAVTCRRCQLRETRPSQAGGAPGLPARDAIPMTRPSASPLPSNRPPPHAHPPESTTPAVCMGRPPPSLPPAPM
eukprot:365931-Chlamydomonas_euryale.AAC.2